MASTDAERDDAYRAIGRYIVEFSRLVFHMRLIIEGQLSGNDGDPLISKLVMGEAFANQVTEAFFAICEHVAELDEDEIKVSRRLRKDVRDRISERNDFAHGDWWIGFGVKADGSAGDPSLWRTKPGRADGAFNAADVPVHEIDERSDSLFELRQQVAEFGNLCVGTHLTTVTTGEALRVRDIFRLDQRTKQIVRDGPKAACNRVEYAKLALGLGSFLLPFKFSAPGGFVRLRVDFDRSVFVIRGLLASTEKG